MSASRTLQIAGWLALVAAACTSASSIPSRNAQGQRPSAPVVCLDPGHPSENGLGSRGKSLTEVHAAWEQAGLVKVNLEARGFRVVLTKTREREHVTNRRRAEIANRANAVICVRLHCDAVGGASGFSVYYPAKTGSVKTQSGSKSGPSDAVMERSKLAAIALHAEMKLELTGHHTDRGLLTDRETSIGKKQGALTGSIYSEVPVALIEMAVLTNRKDERFMLSPDGKRRMAQAITRGIQSAVRALQTANPKG